MREKKRCRWLALLLAVVMLLSVLPTAVFAARDTSNDEFYKIVHLDCGRKYFTKDWIIALINEVAYDGYNQLQLAFGNDGLRFLLNDMSFTANGTNYSHADVVKAVEQGNANQNSSGDSRYLTQSEMDEIIAAANAKGIEIVPLLNLPGHANAILDIAGDVYNASGSNNTLDVTSESARNFGYAIFTKYVDYFAGKGCKFFNFGADEYANDASGAFSFNRLDANGYRAFVDYINKMAAYIESKEMTPRAFNDGLYYNNQTATIDTKIQCCYWSNGWSDYSPAAASSVAEKGHAMINTHGDYYYVLGKNDAFTPGNTTTHDANLYTAAANWSNGTFPGSTVSNPSGSMFCIWCDYPNAENETQIAANTRLVMRALSKKMDGESIDNLDESVVSGGFNADGTINTTSSGDSADTTDVINLTAGDTVSHTISGFNYENNVDRSKLDESIATVTVAGVDAVEGGTVYTEASVTCNTLISSKSKSWKAASGYYYKADDGNYYPVYAKRSSSSFLFWSTYTYTWGYSTTSSTNNVTQIGTQSTTDTGDTPNITVYTKSTTEASDASTTITFTGVYPGTTYVTVGSTEYEIIVAYKTENVSVVVDGNKTVSQASTIKGDAVVDDPSVVSVSTSGSNVTFSGLKEGTTTVTVGDTRYTVTVSEEDLNEVTPLTVEFWITNQRVTANGDTSMEIAAATAGVYSENGVMLSELVPSEGTSDSNPMLFWKGTRLDSDHHQTTDGGVDMTKSGNDFTYIRYWNGSWAYSADGKSWAAVADGDQIVAYYLQRTDVTDEITTLVVDWGPQKDNWSSGLGYLGTKYVLVDYSVKYESGEESPSSFPTKKSLGFHCDVSTKINGYYYRDLGMVRGLETKDYEIYMITLTPTSDDPSVTLASTAAGNSSYSYRGTEVVAWAATEADLENSGLGTYTSINGNYTYSIGGEPIVSGLQIYRQHGMKVTFYVRAKVTEDSLSVHYIDQTANQEFYSYNIAVKSGTLFDENIGLNTSNPNGNLVNGTVTNLQDKTQTVSAKLSTMPAIGAQYRYSEYECKSVTRSEDGKHVYLYYTFTNSHTFVIDFGLPLNITRENLGIEGNWTSADVAGEKYGTATATVGEGVRYTPTKVLTEVETLQLTLTDSSDPDGSVTHQIYIYPASNVLYEDNFLTEDTTHSYASWHKEGTAASVPQSVDQGALYGYDVAYVPKAGSVAPSNSMGSAWTITGLSTGNGSQYLTTTFTGNGFDLIGTAGPNTGYVYLILQGAENKLIVIDTSYVDGDKTLYQVPLAHEMLTDGNYTAYIRAAYRKPTAAADSGATGTQMSRAAAFSMSAAPTSLDSVYDMVDAIFADGFEIDDVEYVYFDDASALAELENASRATYAMSYALDSASAAATADAGVNATTATRPEGTTVTIDGFRVYRGTNDAYIESEQDMEYVNVLDKVQDNFAAYVEGSADGSGYTKETYESQGGPQNEIYLVAGKPAVVFQTNLEPGKDVQVSARAVSGTAYLNGTAIQSQTEMYYTVKVGTDGVITIGNTPSEGATATGMLAIANLKLPDGTKLETPTEQTLVTAFAMMRSYSAAPAEPDPEQPGTEEPAPKPVFTPETFKTKVSSLRTRSRKVVTLTITASTDVDHVVVNGKTYYPMNKLLVKLGWSKTCVFTIVDTAGASETRNFEIVAYNADGLASITYTDAG